MATIVRANCPGCQTTLRIPADWADRPVKCKKCGAVVRAVATPVKSAPAPVAPVTAQPVAYTPMEYTPQAIADQEALIAFEPSEVTKKYRGKKSGKGKYFFLAFSLLLIGGIVAGVMKRDELQTALKTPSTKRWPNHHDNRIQNPTAKRHGVECTRQCFEAVPAADAFSECDEVPLLQHSRGGERQERGHG